MSCQRIAIDVPKYGKFTHTVYSIHHFLFAGCDGSRVARWPCFTLLIYLCVVSATLQGAEEPKTTGEALFVKRIQPLLTKRCLKCHGPGKQESGLRVDSQDHLLTGGDRGPAIVLEDAEESLLMQAVGYEVEDLQMPPSGKLSDNEIKWLREWIDLGAPWPKEAKLKSETEQNVQHAPGSGANHWAYLPIQSPALPDVHDASWPRNGIDCFVLHRLEEAQLAPSPDADRRVIIRRLYLDLCGLPPTYAQVQSFLDDDRPDAYERLVEVLLSSKEYAEHWARHWLDVARYADTKGYLDGGQTRYPFAYTYRNYVVRAFAEDLPFAEFVRDQLAADQYDLPLSQQWRWAGMGFLTTGRRFNDDPFDTMDDRLDVIGRGLMGVTIGCARCHDHKYDPLPTAEYYGMSGILASSYEPEQPELPLLDPADETAMSAEYTEKLNRRLQEFKTEFQQLHDTIEHEMRAFAKDYLVYVIKSNPIHRPDGLNPIKTQRTLLRGPTAYGFGALARWERYLDTLSKSDPVFGPWLRLREVDAAQFPAELGRVLNHPADIDPEVLQAIQATRPQTMVELAELYGELLEAAYQAHEAAVNKSRDQSADTSTITVSNRALDAVLFSTQSPMRMTLDEAIDCYHLDEHVRLRSLRSKIEEVSVQQVNAPARPMMMRDRERPVEPRVLIRGQAQRPGRIVPRTLPSLLGDLCRAHPIGNESSGRKQLAEAIVDPRNPLSRRVFVNRVWQWHFGTPLVATPGDFGLRSEAPTHPELLDYLASTLRREGDSLKQLHRLIVTSHTYQQASSERRNASTIDPDNRLLWRYPPRRVAWEIVRDSLLAAADCLERVRDGRPVALTPDDPAGRCRTLYLLTDRQDVSRLARSFDVASPDFCVDQRSRTGVAQQQLFFLNSPFVIQMAELIASKIIAETGDDSGTFETRITCLFRQTLSRDPVPAELRIAQAYIEQEREVSATKVSNSNSLAQPSCWSYGVGHFDEQAQQMSFVALPYFSGDAWQGGKDYPDATLHYARLTSTGGHAGIDREHALIRRWTAPVAGEIVLSGEIAYRPDKPDCGDGVHGYIVVRGSDLIWQSDVRDKPVVPQSNLVTVNIGDTIDFVVDCRDNHTCDQFDWAPIVTMAPANSSVVWNAAEQFRGPPERPLSVWSKLAQILLQANERVFIE